MPEARKYTEAQKQSARKWDAANLDRISIAVPKGHKETIKAHAEAHSESVNGFINRAIEETMERDTDPPEVFFANAVDTIADHCNISKWDVIAAVEQAKATNKEG